MKHFLLIALALTLLLPMAVMAGCQSSTAAPHGVAVTLVFKTQPDGATAGKAFTTQPVVAVVDAYGKVVTSYTLQVTLFITKGTGFSGAGIAGTTTVAAVAGIAKFTDVYIDKAGAGYTLTAGSGFLVSAVSHTFNVML